MSLIKSLIKITVSAQSGGFIHTIIPAVDLVEKLFSQIEPDFEDIFASAVEKTFRSQKKLLEKYKAEDGEIIISTGQFIKAIKESELTFKKEELLKISEESFIDNLVPLLVGKLEIGGNKLDAYSIASILRRFLQELRSELKKSIIANETEFKDLTLSYLEENNEKQKEIIKFLDSFEIDGSFVQEKLNSIEETTNNNHQMLIKLSQGENIIFDQLLDQIKIHFKEKIKYKNSEVESCFLAHLDRLVENIRINGEENFIEMLNSILLPIDKKFYLRRINYLKEKKVIIRIIKILALLTIEYPDLNLKINRGYPLKVSEEKNICYLHTEAEHDLEGAVIKYLIYVSKRPESKNRINRFIVNKAVKLDCSGRLKGCQLDVDNIVPKITETMTITENENPTVDLKSFHNYIGHCGSCFTVRPVKLKKDLIRRMHILLEGEANDS